MSLESEPTVQEIEVARVCIWTADIRQLRAHHDALQADIENLLAEGHRNPTAYGEQTSTVLHQLKGPHWVAFFSAVRPIIEHILARSPGVLDQGTVYLRAWASRLRRDGDYSQHYFRLSALHNHAPAFLSAVYYLRLPEKSAEFDGSSFIVNPVSHPLGNPQPGVAIAPEEGTIVLFPSWLMHGPLMLNYADQKASRLVIGIDAHLIPN